METITSLLDLNELSFSGVELLIRVTLLLSIAATAAILLRKQTPALRRLIWVGAFSLILLIPFLSFALPKISLSQSAISTIEQTNTGRAMVAGLSTSTVEKEKESKLSQLSSNNQSQIAQSPTTALAASVEEIPPLGVSPALNNNPGDDSIVYQGLNINIGLYLFLLWLIGSSIFLLRLLRQTLLANALLRRSSPLQPNDALSLFSSKIANNKRLRLYCSDELSTPIALGIFNPSIILPAEYQEWSLPKQESAILHELGHIEHHDSLTRILAYLTCTIYWFHPLVWYGFRKLKEEQEKSADNFVLNKGVTASCYAQNLLDIVKTIQEKQPNSGVITAMGSYSFFPQRMRSILSASQSRRSLSRGQTTVTLLVLISIAVALAVFSARPDAQSEERAEVQQTINALEKELVGLKEETDDSDQASKNENKKVVELNSEIESLKERLPTSPEIEEFQALNDDWSNAFAAGDIDRLMEFYSDDAVSITPDKTYRGKKEIRRYFRDTTSSGVGITMDVISVDINGSQASEKGNYHLAISDQLDLTLSGEYQAHWQKQDGRWRITEDESYMPDLSPIGSHVSGFVSDFIDGFDFDFNFDFDNDNNNKNSWRSYDWKNKEWKEQEGERKYGDWGNRDWSKLEERFSKLSKDINREVAQEMKSFGQRYSRTEDTPLNAAATNGHKDVVKMLLESDIDVDKAGAMGNTPLYSAAENGHKTIVKMLLEEGANPNIKNSQGVSPLYSASKNGHSDIVKMLMKSGAKIDNARNNN